MAKLEVPGRALSPAGGRAGGGGTQAAGPCLPIPALFSKVMRGLGFFLSRDHSGGED